MAEKKKILFVITKSNWGGAQRYVFDLATNLPKDQFDVAVALGGTGTKDAQAGMLEQKLRAAGVRTIFVRSFLRDISATKEFFALSELIALFKKEKPDVVHLNSSKAGGLGALAARLSGVSRIVFTAHGWPFWEKRGGPARAALWFFSWLTALLVHRVIVISNYDLAVARRMPFVGRKVTRIYNGVGSVDFLPHEVRGGAIRVLTNAELNENKNLFVGIDAVAQARTDGAPLTYSIIGGGELHSKLETYVRQKGYREFVSFLGFVPDAKCHYKNFDIFLLPSKKEGLPYVLLEAGQAELPVVASNVGGIPEIVSSGENGLLTNPGDTSAIARALVELCEAPALREEFGKNLKQKIASEFSLERMAEATMALY